MGVAEAEFSNALTAGLKGLLHPFRATAIAQTLLSAVAHYERRLSSPTIGTTTLKKIRRPIISLHPKRAPTLS